MMHAPATFTDTLAQGLARWHIRPSEKQLAQLRDHFAALVEVNRVTNLTRITGPAEAAVKHYVDSLALLLWVDRQRITPRTLLDVGTGAGFPAVPIAVMRPDWLVTAIDGTAKKVAFVRGVADDLGLAHLRVEHGHSDHWAPDARFDLVVLRAVTSLSECISIGHRFANGGGYVVAYKTAKLDQKELDDARTRCEALGVAAAEPMHYEMQLENDRIGRALYAYRLPPGQAGD